MKVASASPQVHLRMKHWNKQKNIPSKTDEVLVPMDQMCFNFPCHDLIHGLAKGWEIYDITGV